MRRSARLHDYFYILERLTAMVSLTESASRNLDLQGFDSLDSRAKSTYQLPLRFTPAVGTSLVLLGILLQSPGWLAGVALIALSGALFPAGMLIDLIYNNVVRHIFGAPTLPPTPKPRRFSYLLSTALLAGSAAAFYFGIPALGYLLAGMVAIGGAILSVSLWCLGSWIYRLIPGLAK